MALASIFVIGVLVGFVAHRYAFCIFGALVELLSLGLARRILGVVVAMLVFGLVLFGGYQHGVEYAGAMFLVGGLIQGVGYYLASGCPLGLLVRMGEGSKFHFVVFAALVAGATLYTGWLRGPISGILAPLQMGRAVTLLELLR